MPEKPNKEQGAANHNNGPSGNDNQIAIEQQAIEETESAKNEKHRSAERRHWTFEKIFGGGALFLTFIATAGAIVGAINAFRALDAATRSADEAGRQANAAIESNRISQNAIIAQQRPWISAEFFVASDLTFGGKEARIIISYNLKNSGNAVGTSVEVYPKLIPFQLGKIEGEPPSAKIVIPQTDPVRELVTYCNTMADGSEKKAAVSWLSGDSLFPGDKITDAVNVAMTTDSINIAIGQSSHRLLMPVLIACVIYRSPIDTKSHQTGYIFNLVRLDATSPGGAREIDPKEGSVGKDDLVLRRYPFRSSFAN